MKRTPNIPAGYSTAQAAERLGVSQHEVSRLVRAGYLTAVMSDAGIYIIDPDSVHRQEKNVRMKGRPWDADTAWGALMLLDGEASSGLSYHRDRRLRLKLTEISAEELVALLRKRMTAMRFSVSPSFADDLRERLSLTGVSSSHALSLGIAADENREIDGYPGSADAVVEKLFLFPDNSGSCILRDPCGIPEKLRGLKEMPPAVVAADLATSIDERERRCGLDYLERKLDEFRMH